MAKQARGRHRPQRRTKKHANAFDAAFEAALDEASKTLGPGTHQVRVVFEAELYVTNPGHVGEYRIVLEAD
jgi:flavin-binding protein dodecin